MQGSVRKKNGKWYYSFEVGRENGKRKRIERAGGSTKKEALESLRKAIIEFESAGSVFTESDMSVSDYLDYWFKEYVLINCKPNTQKSYEQLIRNHIKKALGIYKLKQVTSARLQELINLKYRNGFSKNYLSNLYGVLSGSFRMAVNPYELIKVNPMIHVYLPKYDTRLINNPDDLKIITIDDYSRIIERFPYGSNFYTPLQIAFHTGMRAAEVMSLTWDCIDLEKGSIKVEKILYRNDLGVWVFSSPKTASSIRTIYIGKTLINLLKKHHKSQLENKLKYGIHYKKSDFDFVCLKENGELLTTDSLKYLSRVVNYELGINFKFHSLRHTHATMLLESGANIKEIQDRLGHSKLATTMDTYSHVTEKMKKESVDIFETIIKTKFPT